MKKTILSAIAAIALAQAGIHAQNLEVVCGNVTYSFDAARTPAMPYNNAATVTVGGREFTIADVTMMKVTDTTVDDNTVSVAYNGTEATVVIAGNIAPYITATVDGADVAIVQSADVAETTSGEITYRLSGASDNGSLSFEGSYKASFELHGLTLTSQRGAALDIQCGKRINLRVTEGTVNTLADAASGSQKGALVCKGHLEIKQKGTLNVKGNASHAIYAKEYVTIKNATVNIEGAVKDGLNCNQYFTLESGKLNIDNVGDDGVQCSFKDDTDREAEDTGTITISGGSVNVAVTAKAAKALKADGDFVMTGGTVTASTSGGGVWDSAKSKTKASACIGADGNATISGGTLSLTSSGSGGKGLSCDGVFTMSAGELTALTSGGIFAYVNSTAYDNYTGNTDRLASDQKSSPKGIKADGNIDILGGKIDIRTTGNGGEGIESKAVLTIADGTVKVRSTDDAINSSSHMYIKGGDVEVIATGNDGLDSNGNLYISGGKVRAFGARSPECGIDVNSEEGYKLYFTGGEILAVGGGNSTPSDSQSTQPYVVVSTSVTGGTTLTIGTASETYATFEIPEDYAGASAGGPGGWGGGGMGGSSSSVLVSVPQLVSGSSYTVKSGTASTSGTARTTGGGSGPGGR